MYDGLRLVRLACNAVEASDETDCTDATCFRTLGHCVCFEIYSLCILFLIVVEDHVPVALLKYTTVYTMFTLFYLLFFSGLSIRS